MIKLRRLNILMMVFPLILCAGCLDITKFYYIPGLVPVIHSHFLDRYYNPKQIPIKPGLIPDSAFRYNQKVRLVNVQSQTENIVLGKKTHKWMGNLQLWTNTATGLLKAELEKKGVTVNDEAPVMLFLSIKRANIFWGFHKVGCRINLMVETGDGYKKHFGITNLTKSLYGSCDGAITMAVTDVLHDENILEYLRSGLPPKDSDCDGVPDFKDECPGTTLHIKVDDVGCPMDSDHDGVPDYSDKCPGTPQGIIVDKDGCSFDRDNDGVSDNLDQCPGTPEGLKVDKNGCSMDSDRDGVPDVTDQCPGTPQEVKVDSRGCWVLRDVEFGYNKYEIKPQYYPVLNSVISILKKNPALKIQIQGHTDNRGTAEYNQKLSEKRAKAVMEFFMIMGIDKKRLSAVGFGFSRPIAAEDNEAGRALNRRVELLPVPQQ